MLYQPAEQAHTNIIREISALLACMIKHPCTHAESPCVSKDVEGQRSAITARLFPREQKQQAHGYSLLDDSIRTASTTYTMKSQECHILATTNHLHQYDTEDVPTCKHTHVCICRSMLDVTTYQSLQILSKLCQISVQLCLQWSKTLVLDCPAVQYVYVASV